MTDLTLLSPAAQAVLDAASSRSSYGREDCLNESPWIAAAALRAAADKILQTDDLGDSVEDIIRAAERSHIAGYLHRIAAELDPTPTTETFDTVED